MFIDQIFLILSFLTYLIDKLKLSLLSHIKNCFLLFAPFKRINSMFTSQYPQPYSFGSHQQKPLPPPITSLTAKNPLVGQLKSLLEDKLKRASSSSKETHEKSGKEEQREISGKNVPYAMTKDKIFSPSGKAYFILNSLFQTFKKHNEFKLLQQKVHKIEVYHEERQGKMQEQSKTEHNPAANQSIPLSLRVRPQIIFSSHQGELSGKQIQKFIQIEGFIKGGARRQLINQVVKSIEGLKDVKEIMKCYQKLFSTKYCRENSEVKEMVEEKMINKVLSLDFAESNHLNQVAKVYANHTTTNTTHSASQPVPQANSIRPQGDAFAHIAHSLMGFPKITQNILYLIGLLFDKVPPSQLQLYETLYQIMRKNLSFNLANLPEALANPKHKKEIEALMKVNTKENNELIKSLLRAYSKAKEKTPNADDTQIINVPKIAQTQAHYKLMELMAHDQHLAKVKALQQQLTSVTLANTQQPLLKEQVLLLTLAPPPQSIPQLPTIKLQQIVPEPKPLPQLQQQPLISAKTHFTLKFIAEVVKSGSKIWPQINEWLKTTTSPNSKAFLTSQIAIYLDRCLTDDRKFKNYVLPHVKIIDKDLDQTSEIYRLWIKQLLKPLSSDKNAKTLKIPHITFNIIKNFILRAMTNSQNIPILINDLLHPSLIHLDLLFDIFTFDKDKAFAFYKEILQNQHFSKLFFIFMTSLKDKNPIRLKDWLTRADQTKAGELFLCSRSVLIEFIKNHLSVEIAFNWIRDLALHLPSKFLVWILISLISVHKHKKQHFQALRRCIARTINLILIRNPVGKLCDEFKKHLPSLAREFTDFNEDYQIIFADVSTETQAQLKRVHMESQGIKF